MTPVVVPEGADPKTFDVGNEAYTGPGKLANSRFLDGMDVDVGERAKSSERMEKAGQGKRTVNYRLRDWLVSRQRYWGCPIPMVHCAKCGIVPVQGIGTAGQAARRRALRPAGQSAGSSSDVEDTRPARNAAARRVRETDTLDTFVDSSWYFARFCDSSCRRPGQPEAADYWLPVDQYIGGIEHAVLHLLYARFFTRAMAQAVM